MSNSVFALQVSPSIPPSLQRLDDLARNFWFSWNPALGQLFRTLDPVLWRKVEGSPRLFLRSVDQGILDRAATNTSFIDEYRRIVAAFDEYLGSKPMFRDGLEQGDLIAYFCAEYGWHESFPIYSGGLGVLAGDHCKTASDLKLPFVAVGLLYHQGYFTQRIDRHGQQIPEYAPIEPRSAPLALALGRRRPGAPSDLPDARPHDRRARVASRRRPRSRAAPRYRRAGELAGRSQDHRGAVPRRRGAAVAARDRARRGRGARLCAHSVLRRPCGTSTRVTRRSRCWSGCANTRRADCSSRPRSRRLRRRTVFTTHTAVSAGHDVFPPDWVVKQFASYPAELGISPEQLLSLGRAPERADVFSMTRLALRARGRRQRRQQDSRARLVEAVRRPIGRTCRPPRTPSASSPTACTSRRSCATRGRSCSIGTWEPTGAIA